MDGTVDPGRKSWVEGADGSEYPIQSLPFGVFRRAGREPRVGVAIGDRVLALAVLAEAGLLPEVPASVFRRSTLNDFIALGPPAWATVRERVSDLLTAGNRGLEAIGSVALLPMAEVELLLPVAVGDFVDFYSSIHHALNLGRMLRPDAPPLLPNWRHLPVAYHGRAGTIVASGTPVTRPCGQVLPPGATVPVFAPTSHLDFELEVGFITGPGRPLGEPIPVDEAPKHVFGLVLVNDWSARDIQAFEYQPLGPFLGKSFATSISSWVVPLAALQAYRVPGPAQIPPPAPHLAVAGDFGLDLELEVTLVPSGGGATVISRTNLAEQYWTIPQQLAHATSNGATIRVGDLFASGAVSGPRPDSYGSLIELTENGRSPLRLENGATRAFLEDGDTITMRGWCGGGGRPRLGLGAVSGTILPARGAGPRRT